MHLTVNCSKDLKKKHWNFSRTSNFSLIQGLKQARNLEDHLGPWYLKTEAPKII